MHFDRVLGEGTAEGFLSEEKMKEILAAAAERMEVDDRRVVVLVPDHTRTAPVAFMAHRLVEFLSGRVASLEFVVALGTHPPMNEAAINALFGLSEGERAKWEEKGVRIHNHFWNEPAELVNVGTIPANEIEALSGGLMREEVPVSVNRRVVDTDVVVIVGPTFPHEVVGFSGGNKYFFPGVAGPDVLNFFHWLGAVITNVRVNGTLHTPVRAVIDRAAAMLDVEKYCFSLVTTHDGVKGLFFGTPEEAWERAAGLSSRVHVRYVDKPYRRILGIAPRMYDDIWTAGKVMYKLEPVAADGAELIIYAPHIDEVSYTHGRVLDEIGYHVRDYFLKQMDRFKEVPRAVMAHSTHVKGLGTFENGVETPRIEVVLSTRIPAERCCRINLGYRSPDEIDVREWKDAAGDDILVVENAGETLYRLSDGTVPSVDG